MHPVGEQATHILSPGALHTGYKLSPHDNITIVSLDKAAWTDQSCALFTGTLLLQKKKKISPQLQIQVFILYYFEPAVSS